MPEYARLLVHAGASTTRKGDDQCRAQLEAYLELDASHVSRRLSMRLPQSRADSDENHGRYGTGSEDASAEHPEDATAWIDDTQLAYTALESQLFTSSAGPARSSAVVTRTPPASAAPELQVPSQVHSGQNVQLWSQRSEQLNSSELERVSKRPRLENDHASVSSWSRFAKDVTPADDRRTLKTVGDGESNGGDALSNETTSELPTTYSLSDLASHSLSARPFLTQISASDPGPSPSNREETTDLLQSTHASPSKSTSKSISSKESPKTLVTVPRLAKAVPRKIPQSLPNAPSIQAIKDLQTLSTVIRPSAPATSLVRFTTHTSAALQHLANDPGLSSAFRPVSSSRAIDPLERGHWLLKCADWPPELQVTFWRTLESVVGGGNAGWGVWCSRGQEAPIQSASQLSDSAQMDDAPDFGPVRVYCWGEVVKHVYLLLYVASSSKVRKLGLQWIDAEGFVVVQMQGPARIPVPGARSAG